MAVERRPSKSWSKGSSVDVDGPPTVVKGDGLGVRARRGEGAGLAGTADNSSVS